MTRFFVNNTEIAAPEDLSSLDNIIKQIESSHLPPHSIVRSIHIDGTSLTPDSADQGLHQIDAREKIEIFTGTVEEVANESISEALQYLDRIKAVTPSVAMGFQCSPGAESFENLRELYEGFYWLNMLLEKLRDNLQVSFQDMVIQGVSAKEHQDRFIAVLKQLIDAQQRNDLVLLSDLLECEIVPLVPVWKEMFVMVQKKINGEL